MSCEFEMPVTIKQAEEQTGFRQWRIRKEINKGTLKTYSFGTSRMLIYISEISALIKSSCRTDDQNSDGQ